MSGIFFYYTCAILITCVITAVLSFAAWAASRRKLFLYGCGTYICYAAEITEIFFFEYTSQNQPFPLEGYYDITAPLARTAIAIALHAFVWLIILDALDKHSARLFLTPMGAFAAANALVLLLLPGGPFRQWFYYSLRQLFFLAALVYAVWCYRHRASEETRARLSRMRMPVLAAFALLLLIMLEDTVVILIVPPSAADWLPLYLSERNFTENILLCAAAAILLHRVRQVLSIRIQNAPDTGSVPDLERHVDDLMPIYRKKHGLTEREAEVLRLVAMKKSNREIADELILAVGTIKSHVHNLMVKTGAQSREDLIVDFWQS